MSASRPDAPMPEALVARLRRQEPFAGLSESDLQWIAGRLREVCYRKGSLILGPDDVPQRLRFIQEGTVAVEVDGRVVAELVEGECFPVEALEGHRPSGAAWRARTDVWCLEIPVEEFSALKERNPEFEAFCRCRLESFLGASGSEAGVPEPDAHLGLGSPVGELMRPDPPTCPPDAPIRHALTAMDRRDSSVVIVADPNGGPRGLFTLRDVLRRVALPQRDVSRPVSEVMTPDPVTLGPEADGFEAALVMARNGFHHIPVVDGGRVVGLVSEEELFRRQGLRLTDLRNRIRRAAGVDELARLAPEVKALAHRLLGQGVAAEQLTRLISTLNDQITTRVLELVFAPADLGKVRLCWIALGSEGRMEQTLSTDQDNGIVFAAPDEPDEAVRERLLPLARRANEALAECGFPLCKGQVMASNPAWCLSLAEWKDRFHRWMDTPSPEALLNATIFFDLRPLFGHLALGQELRAWLAAEAPKREMFLHLLAANALGRTPPIGFFRDFVVESRGPHRGTLDLKTQGVALFVDAARVLGLAHGAPTSNTAERLRFAAGPRRLARPDVEAWIHAHFFVQMLRLRHQYEQERAGREPDNRIDPDRLNNLDRRFLLESLRQAKKLQRRLALEYRVGGMGL
ncbi:DUF294 nucleotidyltransferase-like domain-containing protein [Deferrisoma camini]|uniref:DUF294 nucleotidyltransferase-like domain-containing protein n=1 Tax=Deferrisoma camini TaxID=1035120 RepID=UPI0004A456CB|nr:DUF294 nucleotidyltransferase-like domain-containing protein [Deferrisoma camini]